MVFIMLLVWSVEEAVFMLVTHDGAETMVNLMVGRASSSHKPTISMSSGLLAWPPLGHLELFTHVKSVC